MRESKTMCTVIMSALLSAVFLTLGFGVVGAGEDVRVERVNFERVLTFFDEQVTSDRDATVKVRKRGDLWLIDVSDYEHYRISDAVITGG